MSDVKSSHVVVVTAGLRRKPDESRLDLINRNVDLFMGLLGQLKSAGFRENGHLVVVSNPVDVLTYLAVKHSGLPASRVIGLGTVLDTARYQSLLAQKLWQVPATQVKGADSRRARRQRMVPINSASRRSPGCRSNHGLALRRSSSATSSRRRSRPALRSSS